MIEIKPMRLMEVDEAQVETYDEDGGWGLQQKMDGARAVYVWSLEPAQPYPDDYDGPEEWLPTWQWLSSRGTPAKFSAALPHLDKIGHELSGLFQMLGVETVVLDGEIIPSTGTYHVFDLVKYDGEQLGAITSTTPFIQRYHRLTWLLGDYDQDDPDGPVHTRVVPLIVGSAAKRRARALARQHGVEGVVYRRLDAPYRIDGARSRDVLKAKFVKTADVVVMNWKRGSTPEGNPSGSATFGVYTAEGLTRLGSCSLIGKPEVRIGDVIEVAYLFRDPIQGGLLQPRMLRVRDDKTPEECTLDQFPAYTRKQVL